MLFMAIADFLPVCSLDSNSLTLYSGRSQTSVSPLLESFIEDTGTDIQVKYAGSATIAPTILEEDENS